MATDLSRFDFDRLDDQSKGEVLFGRHRALGVLGAAFFGLVARAVMPKGASANHVGPPPPCEDAQRCHNCNGAVCPNCAPSYNCLNQPDQCWENYLYDELGCPHRYICCDWIEPVIGNVCICRAYGGIVGCR